MIERRGQRNLLAEVAREADRADARIVPAEPFGHGGGAVAAAVIDVNRLPGGADAIHYGGEAVMELAEPGTLVETGERRWRRSGEADPGSTASNARSAQSSSGPTIVMPPPIPETPDWR
jgi:hypothetical protein